MDGAAGERVGRAPPIMHLLYLVLEERRERAQCPIRHLRAPCDTLRPGGVFEDAAEGDDLGGVIRVGDDDLPHSRARVDPEGPDPRVVVRTLRPRADGVRAHGSNGSR